MKGRENSKNIFFPSEPERKLTVQMSECCPGFTMITNRKMACSLDPCQASFLDGGPPEEHAQNTLGEEKKGLASTWSAVPGAVR